MRPECGRTSRRLHDTCGLSVANSPLNGPAAVTTGGIKTFCLSSMRWASRKSTSKVSLWASRAMQACLWRSPGLSPPTAATCMMTSSGTSAPGGTNMPNATDTGLSSPKAIPTTWPSPFTTHVLISFQSRGVGHFLRLPPSLMVVALAQAVTTHRRVPPLVTNGRITHPFQNPSVAPPENPFYIGPPSLIDSKQLADLRAESKSAGRTGGRAPARESSTGSEPSAAAFIGHTKADADAMGRMILRYGRIASNATRHVTLLRGGINKPTEL